MMTSSAVSRFLPLLLLAAACTELSVAAVDVARVVVQPADAVLRVGDSMTLIAEPRDRDGNLLGGRPVAWSSSNESVAQVDGSGRVTGIAPGTAIVVASVAGHQGQAEVQVSDRSIGQVEILPRTPIVLVGSTVQLSVQIRDELGNPVSVPVQWSSSNEAVFTVSDGLVTGMALGTAWVRASAGGVTDSTTVAVLQLPAGSITLSPASALLTEGDTVRFTASVVGSDGSPQPGAAVSWRTSDASVVRVDGAGLATAVAAGQATITAESGGRTATAAVQVRAQTAASVTVAPSVAGLQVGGSIQLTATARDAAGNVLSGRTVAWTSANAQVASVDASGRVSGLSVGSTQITATVDGVAGTAHIAVTSVQVASVQVAPATADLAPGDTLRLTATPRDATGNALSGRAVAWSSSDAAIATVDAAGLVTAVGAGQATITATVEGQTGSAAITVSATPVATVAVSPATASIQVGATQQLTATTKAADGTTLTGRPVTWATSDPAVATVSGTGLVTAVGPGTATITASSEGKSGTAAITVAPIPVASVTVSPATASIVTRTTQQLTATTKAADGSTLTGRLVTWSTSDPAVATVSSTGLVSAVAAGSATITATSEGKSGTAAITVTPPPVASVTVSPASASVETGASVQLTATTRAADGTLLTGRLVTWSTSNGAIATVDTNGLVTGVATGTATITATSEGQTGTATITVVTLSTPDHIDVSPSFTIISVGSTVDLTATMYAADGTVLTGYSFAWSSSDSSIANVTGQGRVQAKKVGSVTITATAAGISGTATVWIIP